jgi:Fur family ferric uptake transcriptional regulator
MVLNKQPHFIANAILFAITNRNLAGSLMKRMTRQRAEILKSIEATTGPLSIDEILKFAAESIPEINRSTIYRNLKVLVEEGKISSVEIPGGSIRYEIIKSAHHHYFLCNICNRLFTIPGCPKGLLEMVPEGFKMRGHSITLNGYCKECVQD